MTLRFDPEVDPEVSPHKSISPDTTPFRTRPLSRYDDRSRVGAGGLILEAVSTLAVNGSFERMALVISLAFLVLTKWPISLGWALAALVLRRRRSRLEGLLRSED